MDYKILYIDDNSAESRANDLKELGYDVKSYFPSSNLKEMLNEITIDINAVVLDYRLTKGDKGFENACFDAPTIAQTIRTKNIEGEFCIPVVLMSNEKPIIDNYTESSKQDLFDFALTKDDFNSEPIAFSEKLNMFIEVYIKIKEHDFDNCKILDINKEEKLIHSRLSIKLDALKDNVFGYSNFIYSNIIRCFGPLIGNDMLSARLGVSKDSDDWELLLKSLENCLYTGIFSSNNKRWWMDKVNLWWKNVIKSDEPLRRLDSKERVEILKKNLSIENLDPIEKTKYSESSNFWTICKHSNAAIDPFDGIELLKKDYLPWQEKEYLSFDSAVIEIGKYKNYISNIDKKAIRELAKQINKDA